MSGEWWRPDDENAEKPDDEPKKPESERLTEFFFGKPKEYTWVEKQRKDAGLCPQCGEEGRIHLSVMICSVHGPY